MSELETVTLYAWLAEHAYDLGLRLAATPEDFVLRDTGNLQVWARCTSLAEVSKQLANRSLHLRLLTS